MSRRNKAHIYGEPGSIMANADAATLRKIRAGRAKLMADQRAMEHWAQDGYSSGSQDGKQETLWEIPEGDA